MPGCQLCASILPVRHESKRGCMSLLRGMLALVSLDPRSSTVESKGKRCCIGRAARYASTCEWRGWQTACGRAVVDCLDCVAVDRDCVAVEVVEVV